MADSGVRLYYNKETVTYTPPSAEAKIEYSDGLVSVSVG